MSEYVIFDRIRDGQSPSWLTFARAGDGGFKCCNAMGESRPYLCTLRSGHDGPHAAHAGELARVWTETTERDQARNIAAKLEAELATKDALLQRVADELISNNSVRGLIFIRDIAADITAALTRVEE